MSPPPAPTGPEGAARGSVAGAAAGPLPVLIEVEIGDPNMRMKTEITTREVLAAARLADGRLVLVLADNKWMEVRSVPPVLAAHLRRHGASAP